LSGARPRRWKSEFLSTATESRRNDWRQKVEYLESKIRFIEHEIMLAERALNRLR
jgi:hypothetical protein